MSFRAITTAVTDALPTIRFSNVFSKYTANTFCQCRDRRNVCSFSRSVRSEKIILGNSDNYMRARRVTRRIAVEEGGIPRAVLEGVYVAGAALRASAKQLSRSFPTSFFCHRGNLRHGSVGRPKKTDTRRESIEKITSTSRDYHV